MKKNCVIIISLFAGCALQAMIPKNKTGIAEAHQSEVVFTLSTDKNPIVATFGCSPCVAAGGYDPTNQLAFVVHFANANEVRKCGGIVFYNISKLASKPLTAPIQIHLRGGIKNCSEDIVQAIKIWMRQRQDLPMEIVSEDLYGYSQSLLVDSRTGKVGNYDPLSNPDHRNRSDIGDLRCILSCYSPNIIIAYKPDGY